MTESHREYSESLGAYGLDALPPAEAERVRRHLEDCAECRTALDGLRAAVDALPASVEQVEPSPELKARVMAIVESEAELLRAADASDDGPAPPPPARRRRRWLTTPAARPVLGLGAAVAALIVALVLVSTSGSGTHVIRAQLAAPLAAAGTRASVEVRGARAELVVTGLPAPPPGHIDELWVKHGSAAPQPAGTFALRSGSVALARAVRGGDQVMVTVEPGRGSPAPTTMPVIVARV
jgi:anti-sigma factor RsiW